jgi:hypothetical protein
MPHVEQLRQLGRELDGKTYLALIGYYASQRRDLEGVRRVWDILTNERSPYWRMFQEFRKRRLGGIQKRNGNSASIAERNAKICQRAHELKGRHPRRHIASILAREFALKARTIRLILKKAEIL